MVGFPPDDPRRVTLDQWRRELRRHFSRIGVDGFVAITGCKRATVYKWVSVRDPTMPFPDACERLSAELGLPIPPRPPREM